MIETPRLSIGPLTAADAAELFTIWSEPRNERLLEPASAEQVREWIARGAPWGVWEKESGELVGDCGLFENDEGAWELAYGLRRDRWGRGYATEAGAACVRYGFETLGLERIVADVPEHNVASRRILEKLGFRLARRREQKLFYVIERT